MVSCRRIASMYILCLPSSTGYCHGFYTNWLPATVRPHLDHLFRSIGDRSSGYHQPLVQDFVLDAISTLVANSHHHPHSWRGVSTGLHSANFGCMVRHHEDLYDIRKLLSSWESQGHFFASLSGRARASPALVPCACRKARIGKSGAQCRVLTLFPAIDIDNGSCILFRDRESDDHEYK